MGAEKFGFEMERGEMVWTYPTTMPEMTDEQAHTVAIAKLSDAIDRLAEAILRLAERQTES